MFDDDVPGGTDQELLQIESLDSVRLRMLEFRKLERHTTGCTLTAAADLLKAGILAGMQDPEADDFILHCTERLLLGTKSSFSGYKKQYKIDAMNRRKKLARARGDYHAVLIQTNDGKGYASNIYNIGVVLECEETLMGLFSKDVSTEKIMILRRPPWLINGEWKPEFDNDGMVMDEYQLTNLTAYIQNLGLHYARDSEVAKCLETHANSHSHNSLLDYLESFTWDGVQRLGTWLIDYCGAANIPYTRRVGAWWMISAVARAYKPGVKVDHVLLLEGRQGTRKSMFWKVIARKPKWYVEFNQNLTTTEGRKQLRGKWIVVLPELAGLSKHEQSHIKAFITADIDNYRDIYIRYYGDTPRANVLCGDTNDLEYFSDITGNRRFWPVKVSDDAISIERLDAVMDQIWAEAVYWYKQGQKWWPEDREDCEFISVQRQETDLRMRRDPWQDTISEWLALYHKAGHDIFKIPNATWVAQTALSMKPADIDQNTARRIGAVMAALGYTRQSVYINGKVMQGFKLKE